MRLIDADVIIARCETIERNNELSATEANRLGWLKEMIQMMPTADVVPVRHGRWEVVDVEEPRRYGCYECKRLSWHMENYCPNCGAKMDGENDERV